MCKSMEGVPFNNGAYWERLSFTSEFPRWMLVPKRYTHAQVRAAADKKARTVRFGAVGL